MGLAVLEKEQVKFRGVFLWVPATAVPRVTHRDASGVTTTDHSTAWHFEVCGDLREKWVLLALPAAPGGLP